jgi:hypothetical protein
MDMPQNLDRQTDVRSVLPRSAPALVCLESVIDRNRNHKPRPAGSANLGSGDRMSAKAQVIDRHVIADAAAATSIEFAPNIAATITS